MQQFLFRALKYTAPPRDYPETDLGMISFFIRFLSFSFFINTREVNTKKKQYNINTDLVLALLAELQIFVLYFVLQVLAWHPTMRF